MGKVLRWLAIALLVSPVAFIFIGSVVGALMGNEGAAEFALQVWGMAAFVGLVIGLFALSDRFDKPINERTLDESEAEFSRLFPGRCPRCSFARWASQSGQRVDTATHDCVERKARLAALKGGRDG